MELKFKGLVAAVFTPLHEDGSVNLDIIPAMTDYIIESGCKGLYLNGSTGEGPSLTVAERIAVANAYIKAVAGRVPVIVQVGHNSLAEARYMAAEVANLGADAISANSPSYFKPNSVENLVECMGSIADAASDIPFYYYHIPSLTGVAMDMIKFLELAEGTILNLHGLKYSEINPAGFQQCLRYKDGKFDVLWGCDEMLLSALAVGAYAAVGTTFNFAAPLYNRIIDAFEAGKLDEARKDQLLSVEMVNACCKHAPQPAFKSIMKMVGYDCGPNRLPQKALNEREFSQLKKSLEKINFFKNIKN